MPSESNWSTDTFWVVLAAIWFAAWLVFGVSTFRRKQFHPGIINWKQSLFWLAAVLIPLAPLYLVSLYEIPWEVNTDETAMMWAYRQAVADPVPNLFGLGVYWGFPNLLYLGYGHLAELLGGISLMHSRLAHAITGLMALAIIFMFVNVLSASRFIATIATYLVGINHSMIIVSRMALRNHSAVITESFSLAFLLKGWLTECPFLTFLGGIIAGLAWYAYYPSRIAIVLWSAFLAAGVLFGFFQFKKALKLGSIAIAGWLVLVVPLVVSMQFDSQRLQSHFEFQKDVSMFTAEGRAIAAKRQNQRTPEAGVIANIKEGLTAFNSFTSDRSGIYWNPGFGFLDPVTGILMWLGVLVAIVNRRRVQCAFALFYFTSLWMMFTFMINKAPDYTRMAILLPFIGWFASMGLSALSKIVARALEKSTPAAVRRVKIVVYAIALSAITTINLAYCYVYMTRSAQEVYAVEQRGVGETGRFIETRRDPGRQFLIVTDRQHMYFTWGEPDFWYAWGAAFIPPQQQVKVLPAQKFDLETLAAPATTVFVHEDTWKPIASRFISRYPDLHIYKLTRDGRLLALERSASR